MFYQYLLCFIINFMEQNVVTVFFMFRHKLNQMSVILGVHDRIQMNEGTEQIYRIAKNILHPGHVDHKQYDENDIALVKMDREIKFNVNVQPICLPNRGEVMF